MLPSPKSALDMDLNLSHIFPTSVRSPLATLPETSVKKKRKKLHPIHNYKKNEGVSKCTPSVFYAQSPDFHKLGLCYYLKILYL